jgi:restriction system protein
VARPQRKQNKKQGSNKLLEAGAAFAFAGVVIFLLPLFLSSPILRPLALNLRSLAWPLIAVGAVLLGIYFAVKSKISPAQLPNSDSSADQRIEPMLKPTAASAAVHTPATRWSADVFTAIEWRRFEAVCEALFAQAGFSTRAQSHGADGGVDIWLHSANARGPVGVVQCKHWQGKPVGVKEMREFFGVMASHKLQRGTYATTSTYTPDAKQFAKDNSINALDGPALLTLIAQRTPAQQQALLAVAYEGDYWRPTCASCGPKMVERAPAKGGAAFWGCANYPRCRRTMVMAS